MPERFPENLRFLNQLITPALFTFPTDMEAVPVEVNRLNNQILVRYQKEIGGNSRHDSHSSPDPARPSTP